MQYQILSCAKKHLSQGGPKRIGFTLPPIIVSAFQLSKQFYAIKETVSTYANEISSLTKNPGDYYTNLLVNVTTLHIIFT